MDCFNQAKFNKFTNWIGISGMIVLQRDPDSGRWISIASKINDKRPSFIYHLNLIIEGRVQISTASAAFGMVGNFLRKVGISGGKLCKLSYINSFMIGRNIEVTCHMFSFLLTIYYLQAISLLLFNHSFLLNHKYSSLNVDRFPLRVGRNEIAHLRSLEDWNVFWTLIKGLKIAFVCFKKIYDPQIRINILFFSFFFILY